MPANQIEKLGTLLESQNRLLRQEAVNTLSKLPIASYEVENILNKYLYGHEWGARLASAEIVENMLKNLKKENACEESSFSLADVQEISTSIQQLDLFFIEQNFRHLLELEIYKFDKLVRSLLRHPGILRHNLKIVHFFIAVNSWGKLMGWVPKDI